MIDFTKMFKRSCEAIRQAKIAKARAKIDAEHAQAELKQYIDEGTDFLIGQGLDPKSEDFNFHLAAFISQRAAPPAEVERMPRLLEEPAGVDWTDRELWKKLDW